MDAASTQNIAVAIIIMGGMFAPAIAIGMIGSRGVTAIARNPEAAPKVQTAMILAIAFAEAIAIYALVIALIVKFV
jgi:F-type H+-transporting ATPase subunit c